MPKIKCDHGYMNLKNCPDCKKKTGIKWRATFDFEFDSDADAPKSLNEFIEWLRTNDLIAVPGDPIEAVMLKGGKPVLGKRKAPFRIDAMDPDEDEPKVGKKSYHRAVTSGDITPTQFTPIDLIVTASALYGGKRLLQEAEDCFENALDFLRQADHFLQEKE